MGYGATDRSSTGVLRRRSSWRHHSLYPASQTAGASVGGHRRFTRGLADDQDNVLTTLSILIAAILRIWRTDSERLRKIKFSICNFQFALSNIITYQQSVNIKRLLRTFGAYNNKIQLFGQPCGACASMNRKVTESLLLDFGSSMRPNLRRQ